MPGVKYTVDVEVNGNGKLDQAQKSFAKTSQSVQTINQRLKGMQNELYAMAEGGDRTSKSFLDMAKRAGALKNAMGDTRAIVRYFGDGERAVNGMNSAISATTSTIQGIYGAYSLLGGEANDKLLKNMVALESINARLSNAYNLLKPDGKAMLYMNEMAKKGNIFAGAMGKAGGFVFKMIPAFKALSIASFLGEVTGVNDKIKEWITNTDTFKGIMDSIGINIPDNIGISQAAGVLSNDESRRILKKISSKSVSPDDAIVNLPTAKQEAFKKAYPGLFTDETKNAVETYKEYNKKLDKLNSNLEKIEAEGKKPMSADLERRSAYEARINESNFWIARAEGYLMHTRPDPKPSPKPSPLKTTSNKGEKLASNAPKTFNIYIDKMGEVKEMNVTNMDDLDKLGKNIYEVLRRALVQVAAEQAQ